MSAALLVSTWDDGVFVVGDVGVRHELAGRAVRGLAVRGAGSGSAIVDGGTLVAATRADEWPAIAKSARSLACGLFVGEQIFVGTDDGAHLLRLEEDRLVPVESFDRIDGRETWRPGGVLVEGVWRGPPLGIRALSAASDGTILAAVHVGGIPRSPDAGASWHPTIAVDVDVHDVVFHPTRPALAAAAAAAGLCLSRDGGATWTIETVGLDHAYCSAVAFLGDDVLVAASDGHFAAHGAVYRRAIDRAGPLAPVGGGLPRWFEGIVDTQTVATRGEDAAIVDQGGNVYRSRDAGRSWTNVATIRTAPSAVAFV